MTDEVPEPNRQSNGAKRVEPSLPRHTAEGMRDATVEVIGDRVFLRGFDPSSGSPPLSLLAFLGRLRSLAMSECR